MNITVGEFLEESGHLTKRSKDSCQALDILNKAIRALWKRGAWYGTVEYACASTYKSCFYLPFHVYAPLEAWIANKNVNIESLWYLAVPKRKAVQCCDISCAQPVLSPTGRSKPFPIEYKCNSMLGFRAECFEDKGKNVKMVYETPEGTYVTEEISLEHDSFTYSQYPVSKVKSLKKDRTYGKVGIAAKQFNDDVQIIHYFDRVETVCNYPEFEFTGSCADNLVIRAKKRRFQLTEDDYDNLLPLDPDAIEFAIQAILAKQEGTEGYAAYTAAMQLAEEQLQEEQLEMHSQNNAVPVKGGMPEIVSSSLNYDCC